MHGVARAGMGEAEVERWRGRERGAGAGKADARRGQLAQRRPEIGVGGWRLLGWRAFALHDSTFCAMRAAPALPPPLAGEGGEGGAACSYAADFSLRPPPRPPPCPPS